MSGQFDRRVKRPEDFKHHFLPIGKNMFSKIINNQVSNSGYLIPGNPLPSLGNLPDMTFHSNIAIWEQIINKTLHFNSLIILQNFFLFEWLPRSPGLYFTDEGERARKYALNNILTVDGDYIIYDPYGKGSMLDGGIGNIRLKPIPIKDEDYFFMGASSSGTCHEGFPIALPKYLYENIIGRLSSKGVLLCTLKGRLKFISDELSSLYLGYRNVPQLYLQVDEVVTSSENYRHQEEISVSVAVSFTGEFENKRDIFASYVCFNPCEKYSFESNINWLQNDYIKGMHKGTILTDFDQQENHFINAEFSLQKVMTCSINQTDLLNLNSLGIRGLESIIIYQNSINHYINQGVIKMGDSIKNDGNLIIAKNHSTVTEVSQNVTQLSSTVDLSKLSQELVLLREAVLKEASTADHFIAVAEIAAAEEAAMNEDRSGVMQHLAKVGVWVFDIATKIGVVLLAEVIKNAMSL